MSKTSKRTEMTAHHAQLARALSEKDFQKAEEAQQVMWRQRRLMAHLMRRPVPANVLPELHYLLTLNEFKNVRKTHVELNQLTDEQLYVGVVSGQISVVTRPYGVVRTSDGALHEHTQIYVSGDFKPGKPRIKFVESKPKVEKYGDQQVIDMQAIMEAHVKSMNEEFGAVMNYSGAVDRNGRIDPAGYQRGIQAYQARMMQKQMQQMLAQQAQQEQPAEENLDDAKLAEPDDTASALMPSDEVAISEGENQAPESAKVYEQIETKPEFRANS